ncbi:MAG: helix-turn-helix transcriptional regulator [Prevotella sp.]|nr:helix-turn-helix transcriptional regulator [Prevotella sp.]
MCIAPRQVITLAEPDTEGEEVRGWGLFFHPDFIRGTSLGKNINAYSFFDYQTSEALHLSDKEKQNLCEIAQKIDCELSENIDRHSQMLIASNIELLLNYCVRYYDRQFITRTNANQDVLMKVDEILADYFQSGNLSPNYLSDMLKRETGMNAQDRIHYHLIEEAKNQLLNTNKNINELAYGLGFENPPYFSRLFKNKTGMTPAEFRKVD